MDDVICPFCDESGFDLTGLKTHLQAGWHGACQRFAACDECPSCHATTFGVCKNCITKPPSKPGSGEEG